MWRVTMVAERSTWFDRLGRSLLCCVLAGCGEAGSNRSSTAVQLPTSATGMLAMAAAGEPSEPAASAAASAEPPAWRKAVTLEAKSWAETRELLKTFRGKLVVVDVWSTACEPCLREFPALVALQERHADQIVCVGLNCDYAGIKKKPPEFYRERVTKVLNEKAAKVVNILCTDPADELFVALKIDSIPAVFVYDPEGELRATFDNQTNENAEFTYEADVLPKVEALLEASRNP